MTGRVRSIEVRAAALLATKQQTGYLKGPSLTKNREGLIIVIGIISSQSSYSRARTVLGSQQTDIKMSLC